MPTPLNKDNKRKTYYNNQSLLNDAQIFQDRFGTVPTPYQNHLQSILLNTENLDQTPYGLATYIRALEMVGVENLSADAKQKLNQITESGFDKAKFI